MMDTTDLEMPSTFIFINFFITLSSTAKFTPTKYTFFYIHDFLLRMCSKILNSPSR